MTLKVSPLRSAAAPESVGLATFVVSGLIAGAAGGVVSISSSAVVGSEVALPAASITVAVTG